MSGWRGLGEEKMSNIQLKNYNCHYEYLDFGKSKTIVFSNSLGTDFSMWNEVAEMIKTDFNILLHDTRGHGQSTNNQTELAIDTLGEDVIELIDTLNIQQELVFCGLSMGGLVGQYVGLHHPKRFAKIILANTAAKIGTAEGWNTRIEQVHTHGLESILDGTAERWFTPEFRQKNQERVQDVIKQFATNSLPGYCANCAAVRDADFRKDVDKITAQVLIIAGTEDSVTTVEHGEFMKGKIANAKLIALPAAHLSAVECAKEFAKNILDF